MPRRNVPCIRIVPVDDDSDRYVASFSSKVLVATFSVVFHETITGAVAHHSFAEMIRCHYSVAPELKMVDMMPSASPVYDVLESLDQPFFSNLSRS